MKVALLLVLAIALFPELPRAEDENQLITECAPSFKEYHRCRQHRRELARNRRDERFQNLTNAIKQCFAENNCAVPQEIVPPAETPDAKECRDELHKFRKDQVRECVGKKYKNYEFPQFRPRHLHRDVTLIRFSTKHCANGEKVRECRKHQVEQFRIGRFQRKCGHRGHCLPVLNEKCRGQLKRIKLEKCRCKQSVRQNVENRRHEIAKCKDVPRKFPHPHNHTCYLGGYCQKGRDFWLHDHPTVMHHPHGNHAQQQPNLGNILGGPPAQVPPAPAQVPQAPAQAQQAPAQAPQAPAQVPPAPAQAQQAPAKA